MVQIKSDASLDSMRAAGRVVARTLAAVREAAAVGVALRALDATARGVLREAGAGSPSSTITPTGRPRPSPP